MGKAIQTMFEKMNLQGLSLYRYCLFMETAHTGRLDLSDAYVGHSIFTDIKEMQEYYDCISFSCFLCLRLGTIALTNYASYIYTAISGTLGSISELFRIGRMNDAIVLTRKFYDDVMMDLYLEVIRKEKCKSIVHSDVEEVNEWLTKKIRNDKNPNT